MQTIIFTLSNLSRISNEFGINWFRAYINRDGCLPKKVFFYQSNIIAN